MAKQLSEKSKIIRAAISANPDVGNTELAEKLNDSADRLDDKLTFTSQDVGNQRQAMKKPGAVKVDAAVPAPAPTKPAKKKPGRKPGRKTARDAAPAVVTSKPVSPVDL